MGEARKVVVILWLKDSWRVAVASTIRAHTCRGLQGCRHLEFRTASAPAGTCLAFWKPFISAPTHFGSLQVRGCFA